MWKKVWLSLLKLHNSVGGSNQRKASLNDAEEKSSLLQQFYLLMVTPSEALFLGKNGFFVAEISFQWPQDIKGHTKHKINSQKRQNENNLKQYFKDISMKFN